MLSKLFAELARRANNGELFNKNTSRDKKDELTSFLWDISMKLKAR